MSSKDREELLEILEEFLKEEGYEYHSIRKEKTLLYFRIIHNKRNSSVILGVYSTIEYYVRGASDYKFKYFLINDPDCFSDMKQYVDINIEMCPNLKGAK